MKTRFEIVDAHGDPFSIEHFLEGAMIEPLRLRGVRRVGDELVISIEYMHGLPRRCGKDIINGGYVMECANTLDYEGKCDRAGHHVVY